MTRLSANMLLLLAGLVWGAGFIAQKTAMADIGPMLFMALRFTIATVVVLPFALWERRAVAAAGLSNAISSSDLKRAGLVGLLFFGTMGLQQVGILATTVTNAGFLTGLYVIFTPLIVMGFLGEHQHWIIWPGAAMALLGIFLLGGGGVAALTWGDGLIVLAAFVGAAHIIAVGKTVQKRPWPVQLAVLQFAIAALLATVGHLVLTNHAIGAGVEPAFALEPILNAIVEVGYSGVFATGFAFTLMAVGQRYTREAHAAILLSSEALFAALFGALLLGDRLTALGYFGCTLIFAAIIVVQIVPVARREETI